jgi:hypothetical protein
MDDLPVNPTFSEIAATFIQGQLNVKDERIKELEAQLALTRLADFKAGYHLGHDHTVEGCFAWCDEGSTDVAKDWLAEQENSDG